MKTRRALAASFVVTATMLPGCASPMRNPPPPPCNPPGPGCAGFDPPPPPTVATSMPSTQPTASASTTADVTPPKRKLAYPRPTLRVTTREDGSCWQTPPMKGSKCPPRSEAKCNPPPPPAPLQVQCLPSATPGARIVTRDNGTCWQMPSDADSACPPDATCNPPPPRRVACSTAE